VDYEQAKRIDPSYVDTQGMSFRDLDDEVRKEIERDANLLKARAKLEKHTSD
jgi:hypothetical protein